MMLHVRCSQGTRWADARWAQDAHSTSRVRYACGLGSLSGTPSDRARFGRAEKKHDVRQQNASCREWGESEEERFSKSYLEKATTARAKKYLRGRSRGSRVPHSQRRTSNLAGAVHSGLQRVATPSEQASRRLETVMSSGLLGATWAKPTSHSRRAAPLSIWAHHSKY